MSEIEKQNLNKNIPKISENTTIEGGVKKTNKNTTYINIPNCFNTADASNDVSDDVFNDVSNDVFNDKMNKINNKNISKNKTWKEKMENFHISDLLFFKHFVKKAGQNYQNLSSNLYHSFIIIICCLSFTPFFNKTLYNDDVPRAAIVSILNVLVILLMSRANYNMARKFYGDITDDSKKWLLVNMYMFNIIFMSVLAGISFIVNKPYNIYTILGYVLLFHQQINLCILLIIIIILVFLFVLMFYIIFLFILLVVAYIAFIFAISILTFPIIYGLNAGFGIFEKQSESFNKYIGLFPFMEIIGEGFWLQ